ncbi:MAG: CcmD family protein [Deltaproteobacteria bacterium]|nr:CcmD family protein [Deltaproteobacteria bacterium]
MPKNFEYVFAAYGIWIVTFGLYVLVLARRAKRARRSLDRLEGAATPE